MLCILAFRISKNIVTKYVANQRSINIDLLRKPEHSSFYDAMENVTNHTKGETCGTEYRILRKFYVI